MADITVGDLYKPQGGISVDTPYEDSKEDVSVQDFLQLMIAQLRNQDFTNPVDDTQYVSQLAQFATMQQMQELAYYSKTNYTLGLVGKTVTVASYSLGGQISKDTGPVEKVALVNNEYMLTVNGKSYKLNQIMSVGEGSINPDGETKLTATMLYRRATEAGFRWDPVVTDKDEAKNFTYTVYYSESDKFDTLEEVKAGKVAGTVEKDKELIMDIKDLEPGKTYFVNIVAKNSAGKETVYKKTSFETLTE